MSLRNPLFLFICLFSFHFSYSFTSTATVELKEVVVEAEKIKTTLNEASKPIQIISNEQINAMPGHDLVALIDRLSNIDIVGANSNFGEPKFPQLSGLGAQYVTILKDGLPLFDPSTLSSRYDLNMIDVADIKKIEILEGGQSVLYGADAIAGVINIVTYQKSKDKRKLHGSISRSSINDARYSLLFKKQLKNIHASFSVSKETGDGISSAKSNDGSVFEKDPYDKFNLHASLGYRADNQWDVFFDFSFAHIHNSYDGGAFLDNSANQYNAQVNRYKIYSKHYINHHTTLLVQSDYSINQRTYIDSFGNTDYQGGFFFNEAIFNYALNSRSHFVLGVDHRNIDSKSRYITNSAVQNQLSIFKLFTHTFSKKVKLDIGGRYSIHSKFGNRFVYSLSLGYKFSPTIKIYTGYNTAFKAPDTYQLYGTFGGNQHLSVENSSEANAGIVINRFFRLPIDLDIRASNISLKNKIVYINNLYQNIFSTDVQNLSLGLHFSRPKYDLDIRYVFNQAVSKDENNKAIPTYRVPRKKIKYTLNIRPVKNTSISWTGKIIGSRQDSFFDSNTFTSKDISLERYFVQDILLKYTFEKYKLSIFTNFTNFTNQNYYEVYGYSTYKAKIQFGIHYTLD